MFVQGSYCKMINTYPSIDAVRDGVVAAGDLLDDLVVERGQLGELLGHCRVVGGRLKHYSQDYIMNYLLLK